MSARPGLPLLGPGKIRRMKARARQRLEHELARGREHPARAGERLGECSVARPDGPVIWLHTGHEIAALDQIGLIERLRLERDELNFLVTTSEYDPRRPLATHLPKRCTHQYLPYEEGPGIDALLDHWQPDASLWVDPDLQLHVAEALGTHQIPGFWANASMPDEKSHKLRWFPGATRKALENFTHILATDGRSARNLRRLGVDQSRLEVLGFLQDGPPPLECIEAERETLAGLLATRPVWLAAHVSVSEEAVIINAHRHVSRRAHRYLLILMPADATRSSELVEMLEQDGWIVARRSAGQKPVEDTQIFIADAPHELGLMLRLAPIAFFGQTLEGSNGQPDDPFHAAALGSALLHGPETGAFGARFARLRSTGAARQVHTEKELTQELEHLLAPDKVAAMAQSAWEVATGGAEVTDRLCALVHDALDARGV